MSPSPINGDPPAALILGITGAFGRHVAEALHGRGFVIHALSRSPARARETTRWSFPVIWHQGDALDPRSVAEAASGSAFLVHGVNPPGYRRWREDGIPMLAASIAAAKASGARIVFPGNVYVFAPASGPLVDERTPHRPTTRKGAVRREMEQMLRDAASHGVRSLTIRAGDFFGPGVANSWFTQAVAKGGRNARVIRDLGAPGVGHSWAYLPDLAEAVGRLVERESVLETCEVVHFQGHWIDPGRALAEAVAALASPRARVRRFPWFATVLASPFVPFLREVQEMRWLWEHPLRLDNRRLESLIGPEPHTPLDRALEAALDDATAPSALGTVPSRTVRA